MGDLVFILVCKSGDLIVMKLSKTNKPPSLFRRFKIFSRWYTTNYGSNPVFHKLCQLHHLNSIYDKYYLCQCP